MNARERQAVRVAYCRIERDMRLLKAEIRSAKTPTAKAAARSCLGAFVCWREWLDELTRGSGAIVEESVIKRARRRARR